MKPTGKVPPAPPVMKKKPSLEEAQSVLQEEQQRITENIQAATAEISEILNRRNLAFSVSSTIVGSSASHEIHLVVKQ